MFFRRNDQRLGDLLPDRLWICSLGLVRQPQPQNHRQGKSGIKLINIYSDKELAKLGKYNLLEKLGRGGYGTVYRALDTVLEVERAVKVLHPPLAADPHFIERFQKEAKTAARLKHANIVQVYDLDEAGGRYFLAMEFLPGGSLKDLLKEKGRLQFERALEILKQVASALDYAHQQGLVHRDVKPSNILFDEDGTAKLSDFGFSKALSEASSASLSASGGMIGTPAYMAPEVWKGGQVVGPQTDVYSLACVFYEMITGKVLFEGESPPVVMTAHVLEGPQFPDEWPEDAPEEIQAVLEKALAQEPGDRYPNAGACVKALAELREPQLSQETAGELAKSEKEQQYHPVGETKFAGKTQDSWMRFRDGFSKNLTWILAGLVLMAGLVLIAVLVITPLLSNEFKKSPDQPGGAQTAAALAAMGTQIADLSMTSTAATVLPARITDDYGVEMVLVQAGAFEMGSQDGGSDESPVHTVTLDDYYIDKYEVSNELYAQCVEDGECQQPSSFRSYTRASYYGNPEFDDYPVITVDWEKAQTFCQWRGARLPSEAEWEKAARGTDGRTYPWGEGIDCTKANFEDESGYCVGDTSSVGSYPDGASPYGALDMAGNVWEWVADWYDDDYYSISPYENPAGPASGQYRVLRGGSWFSLADFVRSANRVWSRSNGAGFIFGFRCARSP